METLPDFTAFIIASLCSSVSFAILSLFKKVGGRLVAAAVVGALFVKNMCFPLSDLRLIVPTFGTCATPFVVTAVLLPGWLVGTAVLALAVVPLGSGLGDARFSVVLDDGAPPSLSVRERRARNDNAFSSPFAGSARSMCFPEGDLIRTTPRFSVCSGGRCIFGALLATTLCCLLVIFAISSYVYWRGTTAPAYVVASWISSYVYCRGMAVLLSWGMPTLFCFWRLGGGHLGNCSVRWLF